MTDADNDVRVRADVRKQRQQWLTRVTNAYVPILLMNVKKLQFIHKLTASDTSKTAKITKR